MFFLKYFEISLTSLGNLAGIGGGSLLNVMGLSTFLSYMFLLLLLTSLVFGVNLAVTLHQQEYSILNCKLLRFVDNIFCHMTKQFFDIVDIRHKMF